MKIGRIFLSFIFLGTARAYFDKESEVPPWMDGYGHRSAVWRDAAMVHNWYTHDPWLILNEITLTAGEGLCFDTVDMRVHRLNYGAEGVRRNWAFIPIEGKIYAAPFGDSERCIFAGAQSTGDILAKVVKGTNHAPMVNWVPKDEDIIGFAVMVSEPTKDETEDHGVQVRFAQVPLGHRLVQDPCRQSPRRCYSCRRYRRKCRAGSFYTLCLHSAFGV